LFSSAQHAIVLLLVGFLSFLAEINFEWVLEKFTVLATLLGHGCFYMLTGFLCLGIAGNLGILFGSVVGCIGLLYILLAVVMGNRTRLEYSEI